MTSFSSAFESTQGIFIKLFTFTFHDCILGLPGSIPTYTLRIIGLQGRPWPWDRLYSPKNLGEISSFFWKVLEQTDMSQLSRWVFLDHSK